MYLLLPQQSGERGTTVSNYNTEHGDREKREREGGMRVLIVGSGITGSLISRYISRLAATTATIRTTIFDKARGPGGRFCTRDEAELGAQYMYV